MSLASFSNGIGVPMFPTDFVAGSLFRTTTTGNTIDAAGESLAYIGRVYLSSGPGTSKTLSSAGGKVAIRIGSSVTFANGGTNLRVGIQDVGATGVNDDDWTGEPQADLVGGTDTITANTVLNTPIESGSRVIAHGDLIAIVAEMTTRAGADSVIVAALPLVTGAVDIFSIPYTAADVGAGPVKSANTVDTMAAAIIFDDGTIGVLSYDSFPYVVSGLNYNSGSTPDEYALIFQVPFRCQVSGLMGNFWPVASADFEAILYSTPLGTPAVVTSVSISAAQTALPTASGAIDLPITASVILSPNTDYALSVRPTTANDVNIRWLELGSGNSALRKCMGLGGTTMYLASRTNNTGSFGSADTTIVPLFGIRINKFDSGTTNVGATCLGPGARY